MVMILFVVDLPRLASSSIEDIKELLEKLSQGFVDTTLLQESFDRLGLLYITDDLPTHQYLVNTAYGVGAYRNFNLDLFKDAIKTLSPVEEEPGTEIDFHTLLTPADDMPLFTMGDPFVKRLIVIVTPLPSNISTEHEQGLKQSNISYRFIHPNNMSAEPGSIDRLVAHFLKKLHDDSLDLWNLLIPLAEDSLELDHLSLEFEREEEVFRTTIKTSYKVVSPLARSHVELFTGTPILRWYSAEMPEIYGIIVNGPEKRQRLRLSDLSTTLSLVDLNPSLYVVACRCTEDEENIAAMYVIDCHVSVIGD